MTLGYKEPPEYRPEGSDEQLEELVGAEKIDRSALPEAERSPFITDAQAEAREVDFDYNRWTRSEKIYSEAKETRFTETEGEYFKYKARPIWQTGLFTVLALAFLVGQWFMLEINDTLSDPFGWSEAGTLGMVRMFMFFAGAYCAFMAWPKYQYNNHSDKEVAVRAKNKEDFRRKFRR